jgi:predicted aldo/keto reductase-like oxidoreductase
MATDKPDVTRRRFISTSLTGLAAAGLAGIGPRLAAAQGEKNEGEAAEKTKPELLYRDLGKTGIKLPIVSMGAMNSENSELVKASYDMGVRHFDTAALYAFGRNEQMVGKVIKELGVRDKVALATKERLDRRADLSDAAAKAKLIKLTEGSLRRLKTDYIDILYIHSLQNTDELNDDAIYGAMDQMKKDGKIRATGVSTHQNMAEIIAKVTEDELCDVVLTSMNVSLADDEALAEAIKNAAAKGIGLVAMKTQAGGRRLPNQESFGNYDNTTVQQAMLKWVLRNEAITTAIPGYTSFEHMNEDVSVGFDLEYTEDEKRFLADNELQVGLGFCRQCRQCLASCPHGVEVPTLMRTHMYAAQYSNFGQARATLDEIQPEQSIARCTSCDTCTARCVNSVDIAYRIGELKLIYT